MCVMMMLTVYDNDTNCVSALVCVCQNMSDAMAVLPKLSTGLDVNVRFTGVSDFEYTPECIVFDLLDIPLYHGWLLDPQVGKGGGVVLFVWGLWGGYWYIHFSCC